MPEAIVLYALGDIAPDREDPASIFEHVASILRGDDVVFSQLEAVLSERGSPLPQARHPLPTTHFSPSRSAERNGG